jgi:neutral ceramidase
MKTKMFKIQWLILTVAFSMLTLSAAYSQDMSLKVGAARVDVTPPVNPEYPPLGKYDVEKLHIRAIVLDNGVTRAALIGADLSGLSEEVYTTVAPLIAAELNCPKENIIMSATHTHSGIAAGPPPPGRPVMVAKPTVDAIMVAVKQSKAKLKPAKVGFGTGAAYLNVNRDVISSTTRLWTQAANLEGPSDKTLAVVMFTDLQGTPIATYVNYAMHPINGYLGGITLADYPGAASRYVEKAFGDEMVMIFCQSASGDQNPLWIRPGTNALASKSGVKITGWDLIREDVEGPLRDGKVPHGKLDPKVAENLEHWMDALGTIVGEESIRVMTNIRQLDSNIRIWGGQEIVSIPGRKRTNTGREGAPGTYEDGPNVDVRLGVLGIGNIALTSADAEIYNIFAQHLKKASPMTNTVMVTLANGRANSGYIIDDASYGRYTFQVLGASLKPGYAEQAIVGGLVNMINQYTGNTKK